MATAAGPYVQVKEVASAIGISHQRLTGWLNHHKAERTGAGWPVALVRRVLTERGVGVPEEFARDASPAREAVTPLEALAREQEHHARAEQVARDQAAEAATWRERARHLEEENARLQRELAARDGGAPVRPVRRPVWDRDVQAPAPA